VLAEVPLSTEVHTFFWFGMYFSNSQRSHRQGQPTTENEASRTPVDIGIDIELLMAYEARGGFEKVLEGRGGSIDFRERGTMGK
jgi:hypothetical protein